MANIDLNQFIYELLVVNCGTYVDLCVPHMTESKFRATNTVFYGRGMNDWKGSKIPVQSPARERQLSVRFGSLRKFSVCPVSGQHRSSE